MPWRLFLIEEGFLGIFGVILLVGVCWQAVAHATIDPVLAALAGAVVNHFAGSQVAERTARAMLAEVPDRGQPPPGAQ